MKKIAKTNNDIKYSGALKSTYITSGRRHTLKIMNKGLRGLFDLIAASITGNDISKKLPGYIDIMITDDKQSVLLRPLTLVGINYDIDDINNNIYSKASFRATLTVEDLIPISLIPKNSNLRAVLLSKDKNTELAEIIDIAGSKVISTDLHNIINSASKNTYVDFEWELTFMNENEISEDNGGNIDGD